MPELCRGSIMLRQHLAQLCFCCRQCKGAGRLAFDDGTELERSADKVGRGSDDLDPGSGMDGDDAIGLQHLQRIAHRSDGDAGHLGQLPLAKAGPHRQARVKQRLQDAFIGQVRQ